MICAKSDVKPEKTIRMQFILIFGFKSKGNCSLCGFARGWASGVADRVIVYDSVQTASDLNAILSLKFFLLNSNTTLTIATEPLSAGIEVFQLFRGRVFERRGYLGSYTPKPRMRRGAEGAKARQFWDRFQINFLCLAGELPCQLAHFYSSFSSFFSSASFQSGHTAGGGVMDPAAGSGRF